jgi:hypothetical protein
VGLGRRHDFVFVIAEDALPHVRLAKITRHDAAGSITVLCGTFKGIESQITFAVLWVKAMAGEAILAKNGTYVSVERDCCCRVQVREREDGQKQTMHVGMKVNATISAFFISEISSSCVPTFKGQFGNAAFVETA